MLSKKATILIVIGLFLMAPAGISSIDFETQQFIDDFHGYILLGIQEEQIDGDWEGCEYGESVKFRSGDSVVCESYGYTYAYSPSASIIMGATFFQGVILYKCNLIVNSDSYDVGCGIKARQAYEQWAKLHLGEGGKIPSPPLPY